MNTIRLYILLLFSLFSGRQNIALSASEFTYPEELNEKFVLFTDRTYYGVNEIIYFRAFNNSHYLVKARNWSKVFYIELVNSEGITAYKGKYELSEAGANGSILIPSDLSSDNYYLIGYTKWMRNFSPLDFSFVKLCIINPKKAYTGVNNTSDSVKIKPTNIPIQRNKVSCSTNKSTYSKREEVNITLDFPKSRDTVSNNYCISVVKNTAIDSVSYGIIHSGISVSNGSNVNNFIPELNGITVSGRIVSRDDSIPYPNANIHLSVLGNRFDYFNSETDLNGRFIFSLQPTCKKNDMYISCEGKNLLPLRILVDNDYSSKTFSFPDYPFTLSEGEVKIAEEIMFNMQVNQAFHNQDIQSLCNDTDTIGFYGPPSKTIYIKDYIELPNLTEVFIELMPEVMVLKKKGKTYLQVKGRIENYPEFATNKPLILIDRIPVNDIEKILKISPTRINRIELVNEIYVKGDNQYGGIVSIFSKKGDLAGIKLPENSMFFNFNGFANQPKAEVYRPESIKPYHPDYRNTLYWEPNLIARSGAEVKITFYTSDVAGDYVVLIRGISDDGNIMTGSIDFHVE